MLYCCFVVLPSLCIVVLVYCHIVVMVYHCFVVLLSSCIVVLMYYCIVVMLYCCLVVLSSQLKKQHGIWCSRWCWWLAEDLQLCDSVARSILPFFNPPPPIPPNILRSERNDTSSVVKPLLACILLNIKQSKGLSTGICFLYPHTLKGYDILYLSHTLCYFCPLWSS